MAELRQQSSKEDTSSTAPPVSELGLNLGDDLEWDDTDDNSFRSPRRTSHVRDPSTPSSKRVARNLTMPSPLSPRSRIKNWRIEQAPISVSMSLSFLRKKDEDTFGMGDKEAQESNENEIVPNALYANDEVEEDLIYEPNNDIPFSPVTVKGRQEFNENEEGTKEEESERKVETKGLKLSRKKRISRKIRRAFGLKQTDE